MQNTRDRDWLYVVFGVFPQCHHSGDSREFSWKFCVREGKSFHDETQMSCCMKGHRIEFVSNCCSTSCAPPVAVRRPPFPDLRDRFADGGLWVEWR
eukprot:6437879-Amphidinium_carterae.1